MGKVKRVVVHDYWGPSGAWLPREDVPEGLDWDRWLGQAPADLPFNGKYLFPENEPGWSSSTPSAAGRCAAGERTASTCSSGRWAWTAAGPSRCTQAMIPTSPTMPTSAGCILAASWSRPAMLPRAGGWILLRAGRDRHRPQQVQHHARGAEAGAAAGVDVAESDESDHMRNFLDCVRSRRRPHADVEIGQRSVTVAHLGNIARWVGGRLEWDPVAERFTNSDKANGHLDRERRKGYELPSE